MEPQKYYIIRDYHYLKTEGLMDQLTQPVSRWFFAIYFFISTLFVSKNWVDFIFRSFIVVKLNVCIFFIKCN